MNTPDTLPALDLPATLATAAEELQNAAAASEDLADTRAGSRVGKWDLDGDDNAIWEHGYSQGLAHAATVLQALATADLERAAEILTDLRRETAETERDVRDLEAELGQDDEDDDSC